MKLHDFLAYNGVHLIDPQNEFHASCIHFYSTRGFLSPKQVAALKNYVFSVQDIQRLTGQPTPVETPPEPTPEPEPIPAPPAEKWNPDDEDEIPF